MRVLYVVPHPGVGGSALATRRLAEAVRPFGVESAALLLQPGQEQLAYFEQAGLSCVSDLTPPEPSLLRHAGRFFMQSQQIARLCRKFDVVHCADASAAYAVAVAGRLAGRPVLCHVRHRETALTRRSRIFVGAANHFAFVSEDTRRGFPLRLPEWRASVLYDGVEIPRRLDPREREAVAASVRAEFGLPRDALIAAMFAPVTPQKDFATLVRAAARLGESHPRLRFLIVGDHSRAAPNRAHFEQVQGIARAAGVLDRFIFAGFREDIQRLMNAADLCVLCTHGEGLPRVVLEAMAASRPCVATAVDGVPETLTHEVTGLLHPHGDDAALAAAIARLTDDPKLAAELGAMARVQAERRFSRARFARDVHALYVRLRRADPPSVQPRIERDATVFRRSGG